MNLRPATPDDASAIRTVYAGAFPESERDRVTGVALALLKAEALSLVAEVNERVVGHVAFSMVQADGLPDFRGALLAPLAVDAAHQRRGIGSRLVEHGLGRLRGQGVHVVFVYGDPAYYGRFGFGAAPAERFTPPCRLSFPHGWQGLWLGDPVSDVASDLVCDPVWMDPALW